MSKTGQNLKWSQTNSKSFNGLSLMEMLRRTTMRYDDVYPDTPKIVPEKELTEKQLFAKLKKEIKEVTVKLN
jgi:hypothetical protein